MKTRTSRPYVELAAWGNDPSALTFAHLTLEVAEGLGLSPIQLLVALREAFARAAVGVLSAGDLAADDNRETMLRIVDELRAFVVTVQPQAVTPEGKPH